MDQQLLSYIEQEMKRGVPEPMIKKALRDAGWTDVLIDEAFAGAQAKVTPLLPRQEMPAQTTTAQGNVSEADIAAEPAAEKSRKPLLIAISVFAGLALIVFLGIWFFSSTVPSGDSSVVEDSSDQPEAAATPENEPTPTQPATGTLTDEGSADNLPMADDGTQQTAPTAAGTDTPQARDAQRMEDMRQLMSAQETYYGENDKYYTCGLSGGDCKGKSYGYPAAIGTALTATPQDPMFDAAKKPACGKDFVYCGLNNAKYPQFFCYYAKLEAGGYYTASHKGNFARRTVPKIFEDCAVTD